MSVLSVSRETFPSVPNRSREHFRISNANVIRAEWVGEDDIHGGVFFVSLILEELPTFRTYIRIRIRILLVVKPQRYIQELPCETGGLAVSWTKVPPSRKHAMQHSTQVTVAIVDTLPQRAFVGMDPRLETSQIPGGQGFKDNVQTLVAVGRHCSSGNVEGR